MLTAVVAAVPVLAAVFWADVWPLLLLATAAFLVGSWELSAIAKLEKRSVAIGALVVYGALLAWWIDRNGITGAFLPILLGLVLGIKAAGLCARGPVFQRFSVEVASLWILAPLASLVLLKLALPAPQGVMWDFSTPLLLALVPIWVGDSAAMLVGRKWGKTPLAPKISPKKSVEGAVANLLGCVAAAAALGPVVGATWPAAIGCGLACGVLGQMGDLFQSSLKRAADLKDSGSILPGHGGVLDRIDSLLFAAPVVALILTLPGAVAR